MATYHCIQTHYEHGIGDVRVVFALSDTYAGLFATTGVENVSIFELKSSKKDLELAAGVSAQDEQQIVCNEYLITTTAEQAAFDLFYSARDASVRVFVGVFINLNEPTVVCSAATADMLGVLQPDMKSQAVRWSGATYSASPNPRREWQARAITFGDAVLNQFTPKELVDGKKNGGTTIIPAIDSTWKTANVSDRLGWYHHTPSGTSVERKGVYNELVNFGAALVKLRDQFAIGLTNTGVTGYSVVFDDFDFDFEFVPSLPNNPTASNYNHDSAGRLGLNELVFLTGDDWESSIGKGFGSIVATDALKHDLTGKRSLDIFSTVADEQLFVHWRMFAPLKDEEKMSLQAAGNFLEMLYAIAYSFGMLVETYNSDANTLHVKFVSRQNMRKWRVYPIGASSDALDLKVQDADKNAVSGTGSMYTVDGRDAYGLNLTTRNRSASYLKQNTTDKGTPVPLTVSRSLAVVASYFGAPSSNAVVLYSECVPHNGSVIDWRDSKWNVLIRAAGISSALYMRSSNLPARMNTPSDSRYITPVASVAAKVDGQQLRFDSLTGYINHMNSRAGKYYETERTIDVPYLCGFSRSSDGSNPSFNEIALGCEIIYDGVSYIVLGIERDYASITTKLRLQASSRFVFQEVGTIEEAGGGEGLPTLPPDSPVATQQSGISGAYLAAGDITAGDAVMLNSAGAVLRATAISGAVYGRVIGVSLQTVVAGSRVQVALPDSVVSSSRYSFTPGGRVYVRTIALPSANLSQELLTASNATLGEDTIVELGVAISVSAFVLDTPEYIIREELM